MDAISSSIRTPTHKTAAAMKGKAKSIVSNCGSRCADASGTYIKINWMPPTISVSKNSFRML
jgi:hypothetical protein